MFESWSFRWGDGDSCGGEVCLVAMQLVEIPLKYLDVVVDIC